MWAWVKLKNHRRPLSVTFPNDKCNLVNFPRGRSYPSSTFVIVSYMCAATHLDFGFFVYLECSNFQIMGQENNYVLYILQFLKCCSLEPPPRKTLYVWPPETPTSFMFKFPDLWMLQRPLINIWRFVSTGLRFVQKLLGHANKGQFHLDNETHRLHPRQQATQ